MPPRPSDVFDNIRLKKLNMIKNIDINPYPHDYTPDVSIKQVSAGGINSTYVSFAGFVEAIDNEQDKLILCHKYDGEKIILDLSELSKGGTDLSMIDTGDVVGAEGHIADEEKGVDFIVKNITVLSKALLPPSRDQSEAVYPETLRYQKIADLARIRFETLREIRQFLWNRDFQEVDTPILKRVYGGSEAEPFKTNLCGQERFLRVALELHLKRLVIGGFDRIFELGKAFRRDDSLDKTHAPEFTVLEIIQAWKDYEDMMNLAQELVQHIIQEIGLTPSWNGRKIDFSPEWQRLTIEEAIRKYSDFHVESCSDNELQELLKSKGVKDIKTLSRGLMILKLFEVDTEDRIFQPTFIIDHPVETTPLCKKHRAENEKVERFEVICAGMEIANAYTELNDPVLQLENFSKEYAKGYTNDINTDFVEALAHGMPPAGGLGVGIDRLLMLLTDSDDIRKVIPYADEFE